MRQKLSGRSISIGIIIITMIYYPIKSSFSYQKRDYRSRFRVSLYTDSLSFKSNVPIILNIRVDNISNRKESFYIYDEVYTSFQPVIYDIKGREAEIIVPYRLKQIGIDKVLKNQNPRVITLSTNESIIHSINLRNIYNLKVNTIYRVKGFFFPRVKNHIAIPSDNILTFKVLESKAVVKKSEIKKIDHTITPSEIILLVLSAEQNGDWDKYIKYFKLENYINAFPNYVNIYNKADDKKRLKIIGNFVKFITRKRSDYILSFNILNESVFREKNIAYVEVEVRRFGLSKPFIYKYKYTMQMYNYFWLIIDVEATVRTVKRS
ncbi:MAG: hypothetical protein SVR08_01405 [Spirochaetota bacterium]|nr:hypothetical protein [Spirochaetota bacterium]